MIRTRTRPALLVAALAAFSLPAAAQTPDSSRLFQSAMNAQKHGDTAAAIQQYREVLKTRPELLPAWINLGVALVQSGRFPEAIECYRKALTIDPKSRPVRIYLALAYFKQGDAAAALRDFKDLLNAEPGDIRVATLLAACQLQTGDTAGALSVLQPLTASAGEDPDFAWALASALIANGKLRDGAETAERVARRTNAPEAWLLAGQNLLASNEFLRARTDLENAALGNPALPGVQTALGRAREKNADYAGAIEAFSTAVKQDPKDFDAWLGLGSDRYFLRDLDGARSSLNAALLLDAASPAALYALALVDKAQTRPADAVARLEKAVRLRPDWMEAHVQLAALYFQLHRPDEGARERLLVDQLSAQQQRTGPGRF